MGNKLVQFNHNNSVTVNCPLQFSAGCEWLAVAYTSETPESQAQATADMMLMAYQETCEHLIDEHNAKEPEPVKPNLDVDDEY